MKSTNDSRERGRAATRAWAMNLDGLGAIVLGAALSAACHDAIVGANNGRSVATYPDGSWVVTGRFEAGKAFDESDDEAVLHSTGDRDVFLARYRSDGSVAWVARAGGPRSDYGEDVAALPDGSALITGQFEDQARFGLDGESATLASSGAEDAFLALYLPDGRLAWARSFGGTGRDWGKGVGVFDDHSFVLVGRFEEYVAFEPGGMGDNLLVSAGRRDAFVARFARDGRLLWARRLGGTGLDDAEDVAALPDGSCLVSGSFQKRASFGQDQASVLESAGDDDAFALRLGADGALVWARSAGGRGDDNARGVAGFDDGSCVVTGRFEDVAAFGRGTASEVLLADAGKRDIFVARYDAAGQLEWARRAGGSESDYGRAVTPGADGSCTVTGYFRGAALFGAGEPGESLLSSSGGLDLFVARWDRAGTLLWARGAGGLGPERGYGIASLPDGATIVAGGKQLDDNGDEDDLLVVRYDARGGAGSSD